MPGPDALSEPALGRLVLKLLKSGIGNRALYPPHHPEVQQPAAALVEALAEAHRGGTDVALALLEGEMYLNGAPLREASVQYADFLARLEAFQVELLRFSFGVSLEEVGVLIEALTRDPQDVIAAGGLASALEFEGVRHIASERLVRLPGGRYELLHGLGSEAAGPGGPGPGGSGPGEEGGDGEGHGPGGPRHPLTPSLEAQEAYGGTVGEARALLDGVAQTGQLNPTLVKSVTERLVKELLDDPGAFLGLLHLRSVGDDLFQHAVNVSLLAVLLASKLDLEEEQLRVIGIGALLHDIGELHVPRDIRDKPGPLTEAEWDVVKQHPARGAKLVLGTVGLDATVATMVLEHHVGHQGRGYPKLRGRQRAHLYSRIVAVADAYDALTHPRPYQPDAADTPVVERLLQLAGTAFDPTIVKILLQSVGYYPPGTPVTLSDGRVGVVESPTPGQPFLPRVLVEGPDGIELVETAMLDAERHPMITVGPVRGPARIPAPVAERRLAGSA